MIACAQIEVASQETWLTWAVFFVSGMSGVGQKLPYKTKVSYVRTWGISRHNQGQSRHRPTKVS
jgi:hypothetical protein